MDQDKALSILQALSAGTDPFTGEPFPAASTYQHPDVVRALYQAVRALESGGAAREAARGAPGRRQFRQAVVEGGGRPARRRLRQGQSIDDLAVAHARSRLAIEARLARFGRVPMPAGVRAIASGQAREPSGRSTPRRSRRPA